MIHVLFVCLGNICRSPMAEAIFRHLVKNENLEGKFKIDSGGTGAWHVGEVPHEGTRKILEDKNISYEGMTARPVVKEDWDKFDYIIAMDDNNINDLHTIHNKKDDIVIAKLMDFVNHAETTNVPDPYYTGNFDYTYELVSKGCQNLLEFIKEKHNI